MNKLAIVVSHPIQYYAPLFKVLAKKIELKVFYCYNPSAEEIGKEGFGKSFQWDVDLMSGYNYEFLENVSKNPSLSDFSGCDTPAVGNRLLAYGTTHVVVFGWYLKSFIQTRKFCNRNNISIAVRGDSQLLPRQTWYKRLIKKLYYPYFLNKFDTFLSVGVRNKEYLMNYGIPEDRIIFSPHAIDQNFWSGNRINEANYIFLWVAKFTLGKRPLDVVKAFNRISQQNSQVELRMVGSGELLENIKKEAKSNERISFLGFKNQTQLREEYLKANTLILSSESETWGLVVNEAYSCGLNAIMSNICGCSEDLVTENVSLTYEVGNLDQLHIAMQKMIERQNNLIEREVEREGIKRLNKTYSFERNIDSFLSFINLS